MKSLYNYFEGLFDADGSLDDFSNDMDFATAVFDKLIAISKNNILDIVKMFEDRGAKRVKKVNNDNLQLIVKTDEDELKEICFASKKTGAVSINNWGAVPRIFVLTYLEGTVYSDDARSFHKGWLVLDIPDKLKSCLREVFELIVKNKSKFYDNTSVNYFIKKL